MYCIISLPRTSSTYTWHLLASGLMALEPRCVIGQSKFSQFNPRYVSEEQKEKSFQRIIESDKLPLIKIISNHDFSMIDRILNTNYKTVFIKPHHLRKQVLKVIVAKKTDSFVDKNARYKHKGSIKIEREDIIERLGYYRQHMLYENKCSFSFFDDYIVANPTKVQERLNLPAWESKYKYAPFEIKDEDMVTNIDDFNNLFNKLCIDEFGKIL